MEYRFADGHVTVIDGDGETLVSVACTKADAMGLIEKARVEGWQSIEVAKPKKAKK